MAEIRHNTTRRPYLCSHTMQHSSPHRRIFWIHALFWCVYFSFFLYQISYSPWMPGRTITELIVDAGTHVLAMMAAAYLNYFIFFPRFLQHKNPARYILEYLIPFAVVIYISIQWKQHIAADFPRTMEFLKSTRFAVIFMVNTIFIVLFVAMLKFVEDWLQLDAQRKELEHEKLSAELRFLKAQINPHFLFNTLNNLYYLAFSQSPKTPDVVAKLAQMMRYMIYDSNHAAVPLHKEVEYMENYISLEKMRLNHEIPIEFVWDGVNEQTQVTPLILITFLENAFKHGVSNNAPDAWIKAHLAGDHKTLTYTVENSIIAGNGEKTTEKPGIGLQNVRRRLDLSYPNRYQLEVTSLPDRYRIDLTIQLT
jgi:two-component system, LytTR family, sensor histidine kinase AlgZ